MKRILLCLIVIHLLGCKKEESKIDYRQEMRKFVVSISNYTRSLQPGFIVIPQNGEQLLTADGLGSSSWATDYMQAIDGIGREDLFYGYNNDDEATGPSDQETMLPLMDVAKAANLKVLVTDYCSDVSHMQDSYQQNNNHAYISFAADHRELDNIPSYPAVPYNMDTNNVYTLGQAKNFLYIINTDAYETKELFLNALAATNYDAIIMDINFNDSFFTNAEITALKHKQNGGLRKIICYMSIGEAENYRYYWQPLWNGVPPAWMVAENGEWEGNFVVKYWEPEWQHIIYGNANSYAHKIIETGFDGVYLDIIDGFEFFEN